MLDFIDGDVAKYGNRLMTLMIILVLIKTNSQLIKELYLIRLYISCQMMLWVYYLDLKILSSKIGTIEIFSLVFAIIFHFVTKNNYQKLQIMLILSYIIYGIYQNTEYSITGQPASLSASWICFSYVCTNMVCNAGKSDIYFEAWLTLILLFLIENQQVSFWNLIPLLLITTRIIFRLIMQQSSKKFNSFKYKQSCQDMEEYNELLNL